jgi:HAE1 family hydrophobic/amphiphilic exporter-1
VGTFVVMAGFGRSLNVISLAGLAFAVGMVVDNSIVTLENIDRHLDMHGGDVREAAARGAEEVWGAVLAATLTTVSVFFPVLTVEEEAGQLFRDIGIAIMAAVMLSLIISVTVIPSASARFLRAAEPAPGRLKVAGRSLFGLVPSLRRAVDAWGRVIHGLCAPQRGAVAARLGIVSVAVVGSLLGAYWLMPPASYLPTGNRNLVFGAMRTPPSYTLEQNESIGKRVEQRVRPYWEARTLEESMQLPPVAHPMTGRALPVPPIGNFFFVSRGESLFMGAVSQNKNLVKPLGPLLTDAMQQVPGAVGFARQASLFGRGLGGGNNVEVDVMGSNLAAVRRSAEALFNRLRAEHGPRNVRPDPSNFDLPGPELQVRLDRPRASALGMDTANVGLGVRAAVDGAVVGEFRQKGETIDVRMARPEVSGPADPEALGGLPLPWRRGDRAGVVPLDAVAEMRHARSPQAIRRIEELRAVTLTVLPSEDVPLAAVSRRIDETVQKLRAQGAVDPQVAVRLAGTADKLSQVAESMLGRWEGLDLGSLKRLISSRMFVVLLIVYLLMAALFESFLYPLVILFTVPLATIGGFIGLRLVHVFVPEQQMDTLTMLGFVILIGIVVNNAILVVHLALQYMRGETAPEGGAAQALAPREAIREAVRVRTRPVLMTTLTSTAGMLPLVLMPGSGSELYRGIGSVVIGGLLVASVFTLLVVPLVLSMALALRARVTARGP